MIVGWVAIWVRCFRFRWVIVVCWVCYWVLIALWFVDLTDRCFASNIIFDEPATRIYFYSFPVRITAYEQSIHTAF